MKVPFFILKMESIAGADSITDKSSTCCLNLLTSLSVYVQLFVHSRLVYSNWWQHFRVIIIPEHCEEICLMYGFLDYEAVRKKPFCTPEKRTVAEVGHVA